MLVLSRKVDETIHIGDSVQVKILAISGNRVRIGIDAPGDVQVIRGELNEWQELSFAESPIDVASQLSCEFAVA